MFLDALAKSADERLAAIAAKSLKETRYHWRRSRDWMLRLGDGTAESHRRVQRALKDLWGYTPELFTMSELETRLAANAVAVDRAALQAPWNALIDATLEEATLGRPAQEWSVVGGREGVHTEHLGHMLSELQFLQRAYPGLEW